MKKKLILMPLLVLLALVAIPLTAFAATDYTGGLMYGKPWNSGTVYEVTDNDETTSAIIGSYYSGARYAYVFAYTATINAYQLNLNQLQLAAEFYNSNNVLITTVGMNVINGTKTNITPINDVKKILIRNDYGVDFTIYEMTFHGTANEPDTTPPPVPTGLTIAPKNGYADLSWSPVTVPDVSGYNVYVDGVKVTSSLVTGTTYRATLTNNVTHSIQVSAVDSSANESGKSAERTSYFDQLAPVRPTGLKVTAGYGSASLQWNANTEPDLSGYHVYVNGTKRTTTPITATSYNVGGLTNGLNYSIEISAVDSSGNESAKASATIAPDGTPPAKPNGLRSAAGNTKAAISWNHNTEPDLAGYIVYVNGVRKTATPITANSYAATGLTNSTTYTIDVSAVDKIGNESPHATMTVTPIPPDSIPPGKPSGLKATGGNREALIEWQPNTEPDIAGYHVFVDGVQKTQTPIMGSFSYLIPGLANGTTYNIQIQAVDTSDNVSPLSDASPAVMDSALPDRPAGLSAVSGDAQVTVSWLSENTQPVTHYDIYRNGAKIASQAETSYVDTSVNNESEYQYRVVAVNADGQSEPSIAFAAPSKGLTDFTGTKLPFSVGGMLGTAVNFIKIYGLWIVLVLGVIFVSAMLDPASKLLKQSAKENKGKERNNGQPGRSKTGKFSPEDTTAIRREMYDHLTKTGKIAERNKWVMNTGNPYTESPEKYKSKPRKKKAKDNGVTDMRAAKPKRKG